MLIPINHLNTKFNLSVSTLVIFEVLSSLQILQASLRAVFQSAASYKSIARGFYKDISFLTGVINTHNFTITDQLLQAIWGSVAVYFVLHLLAILTTIIYYGFYKKIVNKRILNAMNISYLFHSRLAFFLIQNFFFLFLELFSRLRDSSTGEILYQNSWFIMTVILSAFNVTLAFMKEFIIYQFSKGKDFTGIKTNIYHQIALVYKTVSLFFSLLNHSLKIVVQVDSIINIFLSATLVYILFSKLPFYNLTILKTTTIMTGIILSCSTVSFLNTLITDITVLNGLQVFFFLFPVLMVKILLSILQIIYQKIMKGRSKSPEYVVHLAFLIELASEENRILSQTWAGAAFPNLFMFKQSLNVDLDPSIQTKSQAAEENKTVKLSKFVIEILEGALPRNPNSELLLLSMAEIYFYKLHNIPKAIEVVKRLEAKNPSFAVRAFIDEFYRDFEAAHIKGYFGAEDQLELIEYFQYSEEIELMRLRISKEIEYHLSLWTDIKDKKIDVKRIVQYSTEIDELFNRISSHYARHSNAFKENFIQTVLMYAVYLEKVRFLPIEGLKRIQKLETIRNSTIYKNGFNIHSGTRALVMVSLNKKSFGKILDASGSIESLFKIKKGELIGSGFDRLFANNISEVHKYFVQQFAKSPDYKLDYKTKTYGKTGDGNIFELEAHFILYPHLKKEISIMILFRKLSGPQPLIIVDYDNNVVDSSNQLQRIFNEGKFNINTTTLVQDLNLQFRTIYQAFDAIHKLEVGPQGTMVSSPRKGLQISTSKIVDKVASSRSEANHHSMGQTNAERMSITILSEGDDQQRLIKEILYSPKFLPRSPGFMDKNRPLERFGAEITIEKAQYICDKYYTGEEMSFELGDLRGKHRKLGIIATVKLSVLTLEGATYKIITITDPKKEKPDIKEDCSEENECSKTFGDDFEVVLEREFVVVEMFISNNRHLSPRPIKQKKPQKTPIESIREINSDYVSEIKLDNRKHDSNDKKEEEGQQTSLTNSLVKEAKITRVLNEITRSRKIQPSLKYSFVIVYIILTFMIMLASVNFHLTNDSIKSVESSIEIVNLATARLQYAVKMLQFTIILYTASVGLLTYPAPRIVAFQNTLDIDTHRLKYQSDGLKNAVSNIKEKSLLDRAFAKNIHFTTPMVNGKTYYGELDTFTANDILYNKYILLNKFTDIKQLAAKDEIMYTLNNTANDYLLSSQNIIQGTEIFLESLITSNLLNLKIILAIEAAALVLLSFVLITPLFIITQAYKRLFRALAKVREEHVMERISQLLKAKTLFAEDVGTLSFYNRSVDAVYTPELRRPVKLNNNMDVFTNNRTYVTRGMTRHLFKIVIAPLLLSIAFEIFFGANLLESISTFNSFKKMNEQIKALNDASYQADLFICIFVFYFILPSQYNLRIFNQVPSSILKTPLNNLQKFNEEFSSLFMTDDPVDPLIEDVLKGNFCKYITPIYVPDCLAATHGENNGLLGINSDYIRASSDMLSSLASVKSFAAAVKTVGNYNVAVISDLAVIKDIYPRLVQNIILKLNHKANSTLEGGFGFFVAIVIFALAYQFVIYVLPIRKLSEMDNGRRIVLKLIPYNIIEENKVLNFYLVNEYKHEVEGIKYFI